MPIKIVARASENRRFENRFPLRFKKQKSSTVCNRLLVCGFKKVSFSPVIPAEVEIQVMCKKLLASRKRLQLRHSLLKKVRPYETRLNFYIFSASFSAFKKIFYVCRLVIFLCHWVFPYSAGGGVLHLAQLQ